MRVLQVTATYSPSINGVAIAVKGLKRELEKSGADVIVLAPENQKNEKKVVRYPSLPNPLVMDYPVPLVPSMKTVENLFSGKKPDIVHVHHPFYIGYFSHLIAKYHRIPLVFTYHTRYDDYADHYFKFLPRKLTKGFIRNNVDDFCKKTDLIISPSKSITRDLLKSTPYLNVVTVPSGLPDIPKENSSKKVLRKKLKIPDKKTVLLTVCRVSQEKNLGLLIKSMSLLNNDYFLVIVGSGNYEKHLKELTVKEKVIEKIRFAGLVRHEKLGKYYQTADIFIYPSITETQGLIFLEALSFGLPIVAVDCDTSRDWIPEDIGILTKNDVLDFTKGIMRMVKKDKTKITKKAKIFAGQYSLSKTSKRIFLEYRNIIKRYNLSRKPYQTN